MRFISLRFTIQRQVLDVEMEEVQGLQGDFEKTLAGEASEGFSLHVGVQVHTSLPIANLTSKPILVLANC